MSLNQKQHEQALNETCNAEQKRPRHLARLFAKVLDAPGQVSAIRRFLQNNNKYCNNHAHGDDVHNNSKSVNNAAIITITITQ